MNNFCSEEIRLQKIQIAFTKVFSRYFCFEKFDITEVFAKELELRIQGFLWGENVTKKVIKYPRDWWQAFKKRWCPKLILKIWPIIYTIHEIDINALYTNFKPSLPDEKYILRMNIFSLQKKDG